MKNWYQYVTDFIPIFLTCERNTHVVKLYEGSMRILHIDKIPPSCCILNSIQILHTLTIVGRCGQLIEILHMCEDLVPVSYECELLVLIPVMCEELIPILQMVPIFRVNREFVPFFHT